VGAGWSSPNTGLKGNMGTMETQTQMWAMKAILAKLARGRSAAPLRKTRECGPSDQGAGEGVSGDYVVEEEGERSWFQIGEGFEAQIALGLVPDSPTDCGLNKVGGSGSQDQLTHFRHCQSYRRSCSRWKRRPAAFSTKTKRCRGLLCSGGGG